MTVTYLDTSACGKLLSVEEHTDALAAHLNSLDEGSLFASQLLETELRRMAVRHSLPQGDVTEILTGVSLVVPERDSFHRAGLLPGPGLRSLDALHLVTALDLEADVVISYDRQLLAAAESMGLRCASPA